MGPSLPLPRGSWALLSASWIVHRSGTDLAPDADSHPGECWLNAQRLAYGLGPEEQRSESGRMGQGPPYGAAPQLPKLVLVHGRGRVGEGVHPLAVLGKAIASRIEVAPAIRPPSGRSPTRCPVRRRAVAERLEQEAEALARLLGGEAHGVEDLPAPRDC